MTNRERYFAVVGGGRADRPPFFPDISDWYVAARTPPGQPGRGGSGRFIGDDEPLHKVAGSMPAQFADWTYLDFYRNLGWGLPVHIYDWYHTAYDGVDVTVVSEGNKRIQRFRCSKGQVEAEHTMAGDGSWAPTAYMAKTLKDLQIIAYIVEHAHFAPRGDHVRKVIEAVGPQGVCDIPLMRSPFGKLVHHYLGFQQVVYALHDHRRCVEEFLAFQEIHDLKLVELAAASPAKVAIISDHADQNLISPPYYREFCIPYYQKANEILHRSGKTVSTHLDGNFKGFFPLLSQTRFDLLDGCTPAPMMNYEVEELAAALPPGMSCYCGVPATLLCQGLQDDVVVGFGERILRAFEGRVILNIGDILPPNGDIAQVIRLGEMAANYR